jgi:hypothetical protein
LSLIQIRSDSSRLAVSLGKEFRFIPRSLLRGG